MMDKYEMNKKIHDIDNLLSNEDEMLKYIEDFENNHSEDFLDDLKDYRFWLNKYRVLTTFLNQIDTYSLGGEKHVKN